VLRQICKTLIFANPAPPAFTIQPQLPDEVYPGGTLALNSTVSGTPSPTFQWLLDGSPIQDSVHVNGSQTRFLSIRSVSSIANDGFYQLQALNSEGTSTSVSLKFKSLKMPTIAVISKIPAIAATAGGVTLLTCGSSGGNPDPNFVWVVTLVGANASSANATTTWTTIAASHTIAQTEKRHEGDYVCRACNKIGCKVSSATTVALALCGEGQYSDTDGYCLSCPAGKFKALVGGHGCDDCGIGTFSNISGARECSSCAFFVAGSSTYHGANNAAGIASFTTGNSAVEACNCPAQSFLCPFAASACPRPPLVSASLGYCLDCTDGMECAAPGQALFSMVVKPSFYKFAAASVAVDSCPGDSVDCPGGNLTAQCAYGTRGILCHACADGFKRKSGKCTPCPLPVVPSMAIYGVLCALFCVAAVMLMKRKISRGGHALHLKIEQLYCKQDGERKESSAGAKLRKEAVGKMFSVTAKSGAGAAKALKGVAPARAMSSASVSSSGSSGASSSGPSNAAASGVLADMMKIVVTWLQCLTSVVASFNIDW
jgi:hypothetical protein